MKLFDVTWKKVLRELPRWTALRLPARRALLAQLKPGGYVPAHLFGAYLVEIIASGIPQVDEGKTRLWLGEELRELVKVLRAMNRHPIFDDPTPTALVKYMEEHFTNVEIDALGSHGHRGAGYSTRHTVAKRVRFAGWVADLLEAKSKEDFAAWAFARQIPLHGLSIVGLRELQDLTRYLADFPEGVSLSDLAAQRDADDVDPLASAVSIGLGALILFAGMRGNDLEPMIGLWPDVARELTRPGALPPTSVVPDEHFVLAIQMEDMTTLLAAVVAAPVRLRVDDLEVFARAKAEIESRFVPLPPWAAHLFTNPERSRINIAAGHLLARRYAQVREHHGNPHLDATQAGARWLMLSPHDRLVALVDPFRKSKEVNPRGNYDPRGATDFFSFTLPYMHAPKSLHLRAALSEAFLGKADGFVSIEEFLEHAAREANPLVNAASSAGADLYNLMYYGGTGDTREDYRQIWRSMLSHFLVDRLIGFGGASVGRMDDGSLCFALTDVGRYLLGAAESFVYGAREAGEVVIQPNFDVVFLGAAPSTEATIARFAERVGVAPGLTFRLTRKSVLGAAEAGATAQEVLEALSGASSKPVPKNVEREIRGWVAAVRRARLRNAQLLECEDEESAARIASVLGSKVRRLTPTIFEIAAATSSARVAMIKKLRAEGVFVEDSTGREVKSARARVRFVDPEDVEGNWNEPE